MKIKNKITGVVAERIATYEEYLEIFMEESRRFNEKEPEGVLLESFNRTVPMSYKLYKEECKKRKSHQVLVGWGGPKNSNPHMVWVSNNDLRTEWQEV